MAPVLVRKITRAKWEASPLLAPSEISADAVTADLRTTANTLSFWRCDSGERHDLESAVLALAAAADRSDRMDIIYLDEQLVRDGGLALRSSPGATPVAILRERHVDVERLDAVRLGTVAAMIAAAHREKASRTMTKREVIGVVAQAVRRDLLRVSDLKGKMRDEVEAALGEASR